MHEFEATINKRKSLYGPASKAMVLFMMGWYHWTWVDYGHCGGFIYS